MGFPFLLANVFKPHIHTPGIYNEVKRIGFFRKDAFRYYNLTYAKNQLPGFSVPKIRLEISSEIWYHMV